MTLEIKSESTDLDEKGKGIGTLGSYLVKNKSLAQIQIDCLIDEVKRILSRLDEIEDFISLGENEEENVISETPDL